MRRKPGIELAYIGRQILFYFILFETRRDCFSEYRKTKTAKKNQTIIRWLQLVLVLYYSHYFPFSAWCRMFKRKATNRRLPNWNRVKTESFPSSITVAQHAIYQYHPTSILTVWHVPERITTYYMNSSGLQVRVGHQHGKSCRDSAPIVFVVVVLIVNVYSPFYGVYVSAVCRIQCKLGPRLPQYHIGQSEYQKGRDICQKLNEIYSILKFLLVVCNSDTTAWFTDASLGSKLFLSLKSRWR